MSYHSFRDGNGSFEVFYNDGTMFDPEDNAAEAGWYWWACFPSCIPDGEPEGPFATEAEALADALSS